MKQKQNNPPKFLPGMALYSPKGEKLGWVESTVDNFMGFSNNQQAEIVSANGNRTRYTTDNLREGIVLTRQMLKDKNISRVTCEHRVHVGNRLFEQGMFKGAVIQVMAASPAEQVYHTDLSQVIPSFAVLAGRVTIGRRPHD